MNGDLGIYPIYALWKMVENEREGKDCITVSGVDVAYRDERYFSALVTFRD